MKFPSILNNEINIKSIHKTPLYAAIEKGNTEIVKLLLDTYDFNLNAIYILVCFYLYNKILYISITFKIEYFNSIYTHIFQLHLKAYISIQLKIQEFNDIHNLIF